MVFFSENCYGVYNVFIFINCLVLQRSERNKANSSAHILVPRWTQKVSNCLQSARVPECIINVQYGIVHLGHWYVNCIMSGPFCASIIVCTLAVGWSSLFCIFISTVSQKLKSMVIGSRRIRVKNISVVKQSIPSK